MLRAHTWDTPKSKYTKNSFPLPDICLTRIFQECGPDEGTFGAYKLEVTQGFWIKYYSW